MMTTFEAVLLGVNIGFAVWMGCAWADNYPKRDLAQRLRLTGFVVNVLAVVTSVAIAALGTKESAP